jgi:DNA-binding winged helix-turn-helix (wHTH) protein/Tol biopolymer transport system component
MEGKRVYLFGPFLLDPQRRVLSRDGESVAVAPKALEVLLALVQHNGEVLDKEELLRTVWPDTVVEENNLTVHVAGLRKALGEKPREHRYIVTIPGLGYQLAAPVSISEEPSRVDRRPSSSADAATARPATSGWRKPAFATVAAAVLLAGAGWRLWDRTPILPSVAERQLTSNSSEAPISAASISPDGKHLAFAEPSGVVLLTIATGERHSLPAPAGIKAIHMSWFPGGDKLLVSGSVEGSERLGSWAIPVLGGLPRKLCDDSWQALASPDGRQIAVIGEGRQAIWLMGPEGQEPRPIASSSGTDRFGGLQWLADGGRLVYGKNHLVFEITGATRRVVSAESFDPKTARIAVLFSDPRLTGGVFLPDGRFVYCLTDEALNRAGASLWEVRTRPGTGQFLDSPRRIVSLTGVNVGDFSVSADGRHIAFLKAFPQADVMVADLAEGGERLERPRRLTLDDGNDFPRSWTADSNTVLFVSDRNGKNSFYKQSLDQPVAETVVTDPEMDLAPGPVSPDGAWFFYNVLPKNWRSTQRRPITWMRVSSAGGPPQKMFGGPVTGDIRCSRAPASLCVLSEQLQDRVVFSSIDPVKGRLAELMRIQFDKQMAPHWVLSGDGSRIALVLPDRIRIFSLADGSSAHAPREVVLSGWTGLVQTAWSADGKSLYAVSKSQNQTTLLHTDLQGHARALRQQRGTVSVETLPLPSPDGRRIAFAEWSSTQNVWMIENFR